MWKKTWHKKLALSVHPVESFSYFPKQNTHTYATLLLLLLTVVLCACFAFSCWLPSFFSFCPIFNTFSLFMPCHTIKDGKYLNIFLLVFCMQLATKNGSNVHVCSSHFYCCLSRCCSLFAAVALLANDAHLTDNKTQNGNTLLLKDIIVLHAFMCGVPVYCKCATIF